MIVAFFLFIAGPFLIVGWISAAKTSDTIKAEVGKTMLQLVKQNHATMENTLSSVRDKTMTFLDNHFFSNSRQLKFWTNINTLGELNEADTILDRWSSDGTEYTMYLNRSGEEAFPVDISYKEKGLIFLKEGDSPKPDWADQTLKELGAGTFRLIRNSSNQPSVSYTRAILHPEQYNEYMGFLVVTKLEVVLMKNMMAVQLPDRAAIYLFNGEGELLMHAGGEEETGAPSTAALTPTEAGPATEANAMPADMTPRGAKPATAAIAVGVTIEETASAGYTDLLSELPEKLRNYESGYYYGGSGKRAFLYATSYDSIFGTRLMYKIPLESITGNQVQFQRVITVMLAVYLFFVLFFLLYLLRDIIKPLGRLVAFTRLYEPGKPFDFGSYGKDRRNDEFGLLYNAFARMTVRLDQSIEENYGMKIKQKEQELSTLHSQITPHLLYNTLDSIYWYALESGNADVGSMVKDLSKLLRIGLSKGKTIISVGEELEHVQAYIRLQMKRYPDVFEVFWDVDEGVEACQVPKVIIQPLVENAIFHGVQSMDGEGMLWVRIKQNEETLRIQVEDNGFIPVDLEKLRMIVSGELQDKGYGIRNVHQRIQLHYGEAYGLSYSLREGGGLAAAIVVPLCLHE